SVIVILRPPPLSTLFPYTTLFRSFLFLLGVCIKKNIIKIAAPNLKNKNARLMFQQIPAKVSSGFLTGLNGVVDQFFAAQLIVGSDRKSTRLNYSHVKISYAVFCLK